MNRRWITKEELAQMYPPPASEQDKYIEEYRKMWDRARRKMYMDAEEALWLLRARMKKDKD